MSNFPPWRRARHSALRLFRGDDSRPLPPARCGARRGGPRGRLRGEGELEPLGAAPAGAEGAGFDIVSGGELFRVIKAGGDPAHCTFAGVGKTRDEIVYALEQGIYSFNVESEEELRYLNQVAGELGVIAPAAVRVNPNVDAKTHKYISTGKSENKFGVDFEAITGLYDRAAAELPNIRCAACKCTSARSSPRSRPRRGRGKGRAAGDRLKERHGIEFWSIGGGIGIIYQDSLASGSSIGGNNNPRKSAR
jgi:diaminopimelate decarboxylase